MSWDIPPLIDCERAEVEMIAKIRATMQKDIHFIDELSNRYSGHIRTRLTCNAISILHAERGHHSQSNNLPDA